MNWADWAIIAIILLSSLISLKRGFVKEALSLLVWAAAFFVAVAFSERLSALMVDTISTASVRYIVAFVALFVAMLLAGAVVNFAVSQLVKATGLSGTDRVLGMVFGLVRGFVIVLAILILVPMAVPVNQDSWWQQSTLIPHFLLLEQWSKDTFSAIVSFGKGVMN